MRTGDMVPKAGWKEIVLLLVCVSIPFSISYVFREAAHGHIRMIDFGAYYYGARCALHHQDPYDPNRMLQEFRADGGSFRPNPVTLKTDRFVVTRSVNLPTTLFLSLPFALLPWAIAQDVWMLLTGALLVTAAFLMWDLGAGREPLIWALLAGFMLAECDALFYYGNVAGIVVGLCIVAAWCFLRKRFVWVGVLMLAFSLVLKPHDSGFVWLYFLLAGGALRKRALQTLAATAVLAVCAVLWIAPVSPHWMSEMHQNLEVVFARGNLDDPGPSGYASQGLGEVTDLQDVLSAFKNDPRFYNPASYLICGILIGFWGVTVVRRRFSMEDARLALAAIAPLTLLPVYHRAHDGMLLLLALPACVMLWKGGGVKRWLALGLTSAGILLTASMPLVFLDEHGLALAAFAARFPGKLATILLLRPTPFVLLAMGCFYLWVYVRYKPPVDSAEPENAAGVAVAAQVT